MRKFISLLACGAIIITANAQLNTYSYKRQLVKVDKEDFYSIPLRPEVLARCQRTLNDIRIYQLNADTVEIPFLVDHMGTKTEEVEVPFDLINDTYNEKCCSYVTLKFKEKRMINRIRLDVTDHNFDKILRLEGSNDGKEWFTIRERMRIVRFTNATEDFSYTTLDFQDTEFTYFRVKFDDDSSPRVTVSGANAYENIRTRGQYTELLKDKYTQTEDKKEKRSEIIVELPYNYIISHMSIWCGNSKDFYRNINVYKSNGTTHTPKGDIELWQMIGSDVLSTTTSNTYNLYDAQTKKLKIEIINYDDQPVKVKDIKLFGENLRLISRLPAGQDTWLAYGKENDDGPRYDLVHFQEKIPATLTQVSYGDEQIRTNVPVEKASPLIESKTWLWTVMGGVILIIGYFAFSMLKKEGKE